MLTLRSTMLTLFFAALLTSMALLSGCEESPLADRLSLNFVLLQTHYVSEYCFDRDTNTYCVRKVRTER